MGVGFPAHAGDPASRARTDIPGTKNRLITPTAFGSAPRPSRLAGPDVAYPTVPIPASAGYAEIMDDEIAQTAPDLGEPTNVAISDDTAADLLETGPRDGHDAEAGTDPSELTEETPDQLGGTGGEQAGGAG